jgi:hypothetical protein
MLPIRQPHAPTANIGMALISRQVMAWPKQPSFQQASLKCFCETIKNTKNQKINQNCRLHAIELENRVTKPE